MSDNRRIGDDQLYVHFITFSCDRPRRLLDMDHPKRLLLGQLNRLLKTHQAKCVGFVLMPDHVHALIWLSQTGQLSQFMQEWKRDSSTAIRRWYAEQQVEYVKQRGLGDRLWTPKYYAFQIHSQEKLVEKLTYMHMNPVRAGLATRPTDWKWSSARWCEKRKPVGVSLDWVD
ncbi:MAG: transposase [Planctomycetaceae bacterium]|nr:transposase [Planctomycetaceae bacterium]